MNIGIGNFDVLGSVLSNVIFQQSMETGTTDVLLFVTLYLYVSTDYMTAGLPSVLLSTTLATCLDRLFSERPLVKARLFKDFILK